MTIEGQPRLAPSTLTHPRVSAVGSPTERSALPRRFSSSFPRTGSLVMSAFLPTTSHDHDITVRLSRLSIYMGGSEGGDISRGGS
jgi:hypothetical protein